MDKNKKGPINVYASTLKDVRDYVKDIPGMTITRFYDEAAQEKLKNIYEQNAKLFAGGENHSESTRKAGGTD